MEKTNPNVKICKYCKSEIPKNAKVCPNCRKKQSGILKWIVIAIVVLVVIAAALSGGGSSTTSGDGAVTTSNSANTAPAATEAPIEYTAASVDDMMEQLNSNALNASATYKDQYLEITGRLGVIDSNGAYITLYPVNDQYAFIGAQCHITTDEQKSAVAGMSVGDTVTLMGKCTDVGEVLGYSIDVDSIG